jgi:hypothetical protein
MGEVYEKMRSDLKLRRYSTRTEKSYLWSATRFVRHFMRPQPWAALKFASSC